MCVGLRSFQVSCRASLIGPALLLAFADEKCEKYEEHFQKLFGNCHEPE